MNIGNDLKESFCNFLDIFLRILAVVGRSISITNGTINFFGLLFLRSLKSFNVLVFFVFG